MIIFANFRSAKFSFRCLMMKFTSISPCNWGFFLKTEKRGICRHPVPTFSLYVARRHPHKNVNQKEGFQSFCPYFLCSWGTMVFWKWRNVDWMPVEAIAWSTSQVPNLLKHSFIPIFREFLTKWILKTTIYQQPAECFDELRHTERSGNDKQIQRRAIVSHQCHPTRNTDKGFYPLGPTN